MQALFSLSDILTGKFRENTWLKKGIKLFKYVFINIFLLVNLEVFIKLSEYSFKAYNQRRGFKMELPFYWPLHIQTFRWLETEERGEEHSRHLTSWSADHLNYFKLTLNLLVQRSKLCPQIYTQERWEQKAQIVQRTVDFLRSAQWD